MQMFFEMKQFFTFTLQHSTYRYASPFAHHLSDFFGTYFFIDHGFIALNFCQLLSEVLDLLFGFSHLTISEFGHSSIVSFSFGLLGSKAIIFDLSFLLLDLVDQIFLRLPFGSQYIAFLGKIGDFLIELFELFFIAFTLNGFSFNLKLTNPTLHRFQFFGQ